MASVWRLSKPTGFKRYKKDRDDESVQVLFWRSLGHRNHHSSFLGYRDLYKRAQVFDIVATTETVSMDENVVSDKPEVVVSMSMERHVRVF